METVQTPFTAQEHGFRFKNSFEFPDSFQFNLPFLRSAPINLAQIVYGLCGGMCFAALDYFKEGKPVPAVEQESSIPLNLFWYLWERQIASLGHDVVKRVFKNMWLDDLSAARSIRQYEVPKLRLRLQAGEPAVLVLVREKAFGDPTKNHQVVACGYDFDETSQQMILHLYDPNYPYNPGMAYPDPCLSLNLAKPSQGINLTESTGETIRSFFQIDYQFQTPPELQ